MSSTTAPTNTTSRVSCVHVPPCPGVQADDREAARLLAHHPDQGWSLLCNGILLFEDTGELLPNGQAIAPHRHRMVGASA
ncbi:DUF5999 family protein [Streptomyces sp. NPDC092903]|uniref:DUF5999 family protein n=1 Tax=Streptomyces sp. NPDC092903 TaxID=3366017 RepID=UPI0038036E01